MRVLVVTEDFPALSETFVVNQIVGLRRLGFEITVIADRRRGDSAIHEDVTAHRLLDHALYAKAAASRRARLTGLAAWTADLVRHGEGAALVELTRAVRDKLVAGGIHCSPGRLSRFAGQLNGELARFDAALCHFGPNGDLMVRLARALGSDLPVVTIFHGYDISAYIADHGPRVYDRLFRRGHLFLAACEAMRGRLLDLGAPEERTAVQRMGVDRHRLAHAFRPGPSGEPFEYLFVGRLVEKKGADTLLEAFARRGGGRARLTLIGGGPLRSRLEARAAELGIADAVRFAGSATHAEVVRAMRESHVLVQPSVTALNGDIEASPVVLQEAMALGLPVVATQHGGIPELVEDGRSGLLVPERDAGALAGAMAALENDDALRRRLSLAARRAVVREFDLDRWNAILAERLMELAASRRAAA
jgi:colanic acid/amylovoran biosynthesis glycosyltransferase